MTELSQETRALLDRVSSFDDPRAEDRERVKQRLMLQVGAAAFVTTAGVALQAGQGSALVAKSGLFGTMGKVALCAGALCAVGGALLLDWPLKSAQQSSPRATPPVSASHVVEAPRAEPLPQALPEPAGTVQPIEQAPTSARTRVHKPHGARGAAPVEQAAQSTLAEELKLLSQAQAALRAGEPTRALALTHEHAQRFPRGVMSQERAGVASLAQCQATATPSDSARNEARAFLQSAAGSPLAARIRKTCGLE